MVDVTNDQPLGSSSQGEQSLPDEWISIAAYYIWKNDGQPEGRDAEYWEGGVNAASEGWESSRRTADVGRRALKRRGGMQSKPSPANVCSDS